MADKKNKFSFSFFNFSYEKIRAVFTYTLKWLLICTVVGSFAGSASAGFLVSLDWVTSWRENHLWIIALLPVCGLAIGLAYYYWGASVVKGNNLLLEELHNPQKTVPFKMAPLVYLGTILTHLFGGSAGREGTAIQMGGAIADQFTQVFRLNPAERKIILIAGISAGFGSVFGTPLAGAVFGLEVFIIGRMRYDAIIPAFFSAVIADVICKSWGVQHTHYEIGLVPSITIIGVLLAVAAGICFGTVAQLFSKITHAIGRFFEQKIKYVPLRPFIGGIFIAATVFTIGTSKYIGLGIPTIVGSFNEQLPAYDFAVKLLFTAFTLAAGFKGGEVTPLFFIGATLGNALSLFIPLPMALLAGMGFLAVFAGAANTPLACAVMGVELFGVGPAVYIAIACVIAYLFSGHSGIYQSQVIGSPKGQYFAAHKGKRLSDLN